MPIIINTKPTTGIANKLRVNSKTPNKKFELNSAPNVLIPNKVFAQGHPQIYSDNETPTGKKTLLKIPIIRNKTESATDKITRLFKKFI